MFILIPFRNSLLVNHGRAPIRGCRRDSAHDWDDPQRGGAYSTWCRSQAATGEEQQEQQAWDHHEIHTVGFALYCQNRLKVNHTNKTCLELDICWVHVVSAG